MGFGREKQKRISRNGIKPPADRTSLPPLCQLAGSLHWRNNKTARLYLEAGGELTASVVVITQGSQP